MKNGEKRAVSTKRALKYYILRIYDTMPCPRRSWGKIGAIWLPGFALVKIKNALFVLFKSKIIFLQPYN